MVEGARLESVCRGNSTVGSNPTLSASNKLLKIMLPGLTPRISEYSAVATTLISQARSIL